MNLLLMEMVMRAPVMAFAALLAIGISADAEPQKLAGPKPLRPDQTTQKKPQIVLASADTPRSPAVNAGQAAEAPTKRRVAPRVTTCRCGDVQTDPEAQEQ